MVSKLSELWSGLFTRIPDPRVKKAPDPGSGSATLILVWLNSLLFIWEISVESFDSLAVAASQFCTLFKIVIVCFTSLSFRIGSRDWYRSGRNQFNTKTVFNNFSFLQISKFFHIKVFYFSFKRFIIPVPTLPHRYVIMLWMNVLYQRDCWLSWIQLRKIVSRGFLTECPSPHPTYIPMVRMV